MRQTIEQRRQHHQTKEDRQHKVRLELAQRMRGTFSPRYGRQLPSAYQLAIYRREFTTLSNKLNLPDDWQDAR